MFVDKFKHPPAEIMRFQKMPEAIVPHRVV
jgi:hypothetical protein